MEALGRSHTCRSPWTSALSRDRPLSPWQRIVSALACFYLMQARPGECTLMKTNILYTPCSFPLDRSTEWVPVSCEHSVAPGGGEGGS